jgi:hypothetical protein
MRVAVIVVLAVFVLCSSAHAQAPRLGLGIMLGDPTGLNVKLWRGTRVAIDGAAGWSLGGTERLHLHGDFLLHTYGLLGVKRGRLPLYYGLGGRILIKEDADTRIGLRVPVGLDYIFEGAPFDIFVEFVPTLDLAPDTDLYLEAALGVRYVFR